MAPRRLTNTGWDLPSGPTLPPGSGLEAPPAPSSDDEASSSNVRMKISSSAATMAAPQSSLADTKVPPSRRPRPLESTQAEPQPARISTTTEMTPSPSGRSDLVRGAAVGLGVFLVGGLVLAGVLLSAGPDEDVTSVPLDETTSEMTVRASEPPPEPAPAPEEDPVAEPAPVTPPAAPAPIEAEEPPEEPPRARADRARSRTHARSRPRRSTATEEPAADPPPAPRGTPDRIRVSSGAEVRADDF